MNVQKQAQFDDRIRNLIALAQDGSKHSRTLLFSHICDLFLQRRPMASETQVRMLTEILKELLNQVEISTRQGIATALCALSNPPAELTDIMCEDVVEVSGPLLEKAIISDEKLIHLIRYGSEAHRIHISRRFGLSPLVRHELDKAQKTSQSSKLKYSLNELEKLAIDENPDLDEETTASILELLRAQNIHKEYAEPELEAKTPSAPKKELPTFSIFTNLPPEPETPAATTAPSDEEPIDWQKKKGNQIKVTTEKPAAPPPLSREKPSGKEPAPGRENTPHKDSGAHYPPERAANDAILTRRRPEPEPLLHMEKSAEGLTTDILQQVQNARAETQRQRQLVRSVADWFWEVDRTGAISFLSEEAFTVFGQPAQSLVGQDMIALYSTPEAKAGDNAPTAESFESLFERRVSFRNKPFYVTSPLGDRSLWYVSAIAIFDIETGRFNGFRGSARAEDGESLSSDDAMDKMDLPPSGDASPTYATSPETVQTPDISGKAAANSPHEEIAAELLHNLSHEFRTPLNAIIGFSEMIDMEAWGPVNEKYHQNTKNILAAAVQLKEAVNDVLDSAKLEAGLMQIDPESFSLKAVLKDCRENVASMARDLQVELIDNNNNIDVILYNDKQSVELCLTKILASTLKRAAPGDILSPSVLINSNAQVRIEIPVLGPEIDEKDAPRLFEKLQIAPTMRQNNQKNTLNYAPKVSIGFGLSIAQKLAQLIGGNISTHISRGKVSHLVLTLSNHDLPG